MENQRHRIWSVIDTGTGEVKSLNGLISCEPNSIEIRNTRTGEIYKIDVGGLVVRAEDLEDWQ